MANPTAIHRRWHCYLLTGPGCNHADAKRWPADPYRIPALVTSDLDAVLEWLIARRWDLTARAAPDTLREDLVGVDDAITRDLVARVPVASCHRVGDTEVHLVVAGSIAGHAYPMMLPAVRAALARWMSADERAEISLALIENDHPLRHLGGWIVDALLPLSGGEAAVLVDEIHAHVSARLVLKGDAQGMRDAITALRVRRMSLDEHASAIVYLADTMEALTPAARAGIRADAHNWELHKAVRALTSKASDRCRAITAEQRRVLRALNLHTPPRWRHPINGLRLIPPTQAMYAAITANSSIKEESW